MFESGRSSAEEQFREMRSMYEEQQRLTHTGSWKWDIVKDEIIWSEEAYKIFGLETDEDKIKISNNLCCMCNETDRLSISEAINKALKEQKPFDFKYWIDLPDGIKKYIHTKANTQKDVSGQYVSMIGIIQDITEYKPAKDQEKRENAFRHTIIKLSREFINNPFEKSEEAIIKALQTAGEYCNTDRSAVYRYDWKNETAECLYCWDRLNISYIGKGDIVPFSAVSEIVECNRNGDIYFKNTGYLPDMNQNINGMLRGTVRSLAAFPLMNDNKVWGILTFGLNDKNKVWTDTETEDINIFCEMLINAFSRKERFTALHEAQRNNRLILDSTDEYICMFDQNNKVININEKFARRLHKNVTDLIGTDFKEVLPDGMYKDLHIQRYDMIRKTFESGEPAVIEDSRDGMWFFHRFYPIYTDGHVTAVSMFTSDITDKKRAEEEFYKNAVLEKEAEILRQKEHEYLEILDSSVLASWIYNFKSCALEYSGEWRKHIVGENIPSEDAGEYFMSLIHPDDVEKTIRVKNDSINGKLSKYESKYRLKTLNGNYIWVIDHGKIKYDDTGAPVKIYGTSMDITEREEVLETLKQNELRMRLAADGGKVGIYNYNFKTGEHYWSPQMRALWGLNDDEPVILNNNTILNGLHPDDRQSVRSALERSGDPAQDGIVSMDFRIIWPDKTVRWINYQSLTEFSINGDNRYPVNTAGAVIDITERKLAEEALRVSEEKLRTILENSRDGINMLDLASGRYIYISPAQAEMTGFNADEINSITEAEVYERVHPDDRALFIEQHKLIASGKDTFNEVEYRWKVRSGEYRWFSDKCKLVRNNQGQPIYLVGISRDITDRRHAGEQLKKLKDNLAAEVEILTAMHQIYSNFIIRNEFNTIYREILQATISLTGAKKGSIQHLDEENKKLKMIYGYGLGKKFLDFFDCIDPETGPCGKAFKERNRIFIDNVSQSEIFNKKSGLQYFIDEDIQCEQSMPLICSSGKIVGVLNIYYNFKKEYEERELRMMDMFARFAADTIELTKTEEALRQSKNHALSLVEDLKKADSNKNEFLFTLSHELRNPLASIAAGFSLLEMSKNQQQIIKTKEIIKRQLDQLCHLIDDLLDIARITANKIILKKKRIDINKIVACVSEDYLKLFEEKGVKIITQNDKNPLYLDADPIRLTQIIGNLLHNSLKFTEPGGETLLSVFKDQCEVFIIVADTGIGIKPESLSDVFIPFKQENHSMDRHNGGLGLGLSVVKAITELHGGSVSVFSGGLGKGTKFIVKLPLEPEDFNREAV